MPRPALVRRCPRGQYNVRQLHNNLECPPPQAHRLLHIVQSTTIARQAVWPQMVRRVVVELVMPLSQVVHFIMRRIVGVREIYGRHVGILRTPGVESRVEKFVALGLVLLALFALKAVVLLPPALPEVVVDLGLVLLYLSVRSGNDCVGRPTCSGHMQLGNFLPLRSKRVGTGVSRSRSDSTHSNIGTAFSSTLVTAPTSAL